MNKKAFIIAFALLALTTKIFAWGKEGHQMVAEIAEYYLDKSTKDSLNKYLDGITFEEAATWMDEIKSDHHNDYMKPWHYINIEKDATYVASEEKNIITVLELIISQLQNRSGQTAEEINRNIKMLFHLVGDLHQPLHVGYGDDKGGNDVHVVFEGKSKRNLHQVWDETIIQKQKINAEDCIYLAKKLSAADIKARKHIDVIGWMNESRALLPNVYAFTGENIGKSYVKKNTPVIKRQLLYAGIRLAAVLEQAFKK
jgi:hypothetical protein